MSVTVCGVSRSVLVIAHEDDCPPALVSTWAQAGPVALDILRPYAGDPLPDTLARHSGLVVLGGGMGAYDSARIR